MSSLVAIAIAGALAAALFVLPVQTYFGQDERLEQRRDQLAQLEQVNDDLRLEVKRLGTDDGVREAFFAADCREALQSDEGPAGRAKVREHLQHALNDSTFLATHLGPEATNERTILYEDPDLGFCICAHVYSGPKQGQPHDHGPA